MKECEDFIYEIHRLAKYWHEQENLADKEPHAKLLSMAFSMLVMLDGCSGSYDGNINKLAWECNKRGISLHDMLYEKENE